MRIEPETRRRIVLPLLAAGLGAIYLFVFLPLDRKAQSLDAPLKQSWRRLAAAMGRTNALTLDFVGLTNQFNDIRAALDTVKTARQHARARVELDAAAREQISLPFLLVDYHNETGRRMDTLAQLAREQKVKLEAGVFDGFPEHSADLSQPSLLWAQLAFLDELLTTAINANVTTIHSVASQTPQTNGAPASAGLSLAELSVQIELTGATTNVARFLQAVPLRAGEIRAAGLPAAPTNKPALFIDRVVLRKQTPEKPDEVHLSLRVVGFVFPQ